VARHPDSADGLFVAGLASLRVGDLAAARGYLEHGLQQRDDSDVRLALGMLAEAEHRRDEALVQYAAALELNPSNRDAQVRQARLQAKAR
jgi:tetratricopeptide (TPR) repeat protein